MAQEILNRDEIPIDPERTGGEPVPQRVSGPPVRQELAHQVTHPLRAEVPIRVSEEVIALNKTLQKGDFQEVVKGEDSEKWTEILSKYSLDDIKYKM